jgi:exopolysaccharide biosynthesis polyprenyl glycosylphosphotransferase
MVRGMADSGYTPFKKFTIFLDVLLTLVSFLLAYVLRNSIIFDRHGELFGLRQYLWVLWVIIPVWPIVLKYFGLYDGALVAKTATITFSILKSVLIASLVLASAIYAVKDSLFSRLFFAFFICIDFFLLLVEKMILKWVYHMPRNAFNDRNVLLVSAPEGVFKFTNLVSHEEDVYVNIIGYLTIDNSRNEVDGVECLGSMEDFNRIILTKAVDEVIFVLPKAYIPEIEGYIIDCEKMGITVRMLLDLYDLKLAKTQISYIGNLPMLSFRTVNLNENQKFLKRIIDIVGAIVGLILTAMIFIIFGPAIKLESPGPIVYSQIRVGQNGRKFRCYKFRTMYEGADEHKKELEHMNMMKGAIFKVENDPRITRIGSFMRKHSLDEFPQFYNVLKGEMSLVGTRPPTVDEVEQYEKHHRRRLSIKPGITGLWQVSGRNEIVDFDEIVALDVKYIDNWSLWLDIKIMFKTVFSVFRSTGM